MGWIKERIEAEHRKYYSMKNGLEKCNLDWAKLAEIKIITQLKEELEECDLIFEEDNGLGRDGGYNCEQVRKVLFDALT